VAASTRDNPVRFGVFELDATGKQLRKSGQDLRLPQQPLKILCLLLERPDEIVTREELRTRLWSSDVFVDFDHGLNKSVQKLRDALGDSANSPRFIETIPKVGYRFIAPIRSETRSPAPKVLEAPASPPTAEPTLPLSATPSQTKVRNPRTKWFLVAAAIALLAVVGGWSLRNRFATTEPIRSLAVLPVENLSGDTSQDYFADGMTDELITMLAKRSNLRITSRTSVMQYKDAHRPLADIARELNVDAILEGSVSRSQDRIHLNLQLIRGATDSHLWADSYDRAFSDTSLPADAASDIAKRLHSYVQSNVAPRYVNPEAHDALLRGKYLWFTDKLMDSGAYFQKATQIEPDYAEAWAWLSAYYGEAYAANLLEPRASLQPMWDAAQRSMQLDPTLPDAHWAMGASYFMVRWDWAKADREFQQAISMNPQNAEYYYIRANLLEVENRFDEAIAIEKKAMDLDPLERPEGLASIYIGARQYDAALADLQLRMKAFPNSPDLLIAAAQAWRFRGDFKEVVNAWEKWHIVVGDPHSAAELRRAYRKGGGRGFIQWQLNRRLAQSKSAFISPGELALYYAELGDKERALKLLEDSFNQHTIDAMWIQTTPAFDSLHADPRYRDMVRRTGLPPSY
jgi:TolB-like protein/DNA-binding winged helix-turn-helix (wHTH) protein